MYIENEDRLEQSADEVYPLVRDELPALLPHLPDVEEIVELSRERTADNRVRVTNRWRAKATVPKMIGRFLPPDIFEWTDHALWKDDEHCVEYRLEGFGYEVEGINYFTPDAGGTIIRVTASVTIHPEKFKIPRLLFNKAFPVLEGTIKKAVQPNLTALARGLRSYFRQKR
jgi:hypothetical protein